MIDLHKAIGKLPIINTKTWFYINKYALLWSL